MKPQAILYIIAGILYFIYSMKKAADEKKKQQSPPRDKPITPPATFGDIQHEIKKYQEQTKAARTVSAPTDKILIKNKSSKPETLLDEMRRASVAEVEVTEKAAAMESKRQERSLYHIQSEEEQEQAMREHRESFQLDVRQAFVGSLIFERKYQ